MMTPTKCTFRNRSVSGACAGSNVPHRSQIYGGVTPHQHGRGIKIKSWISCVFVSFFIKNIISLCNMIVVINAPGTKTRLSEVVDVIGFVLHPM